MARRASISFIQWPWPCVGTEEEALLAKQLQMIHARMHAEDPDAAEDMAEGFNRGRDQEPERIFEKLDVNNDKALDFSELVSGLNEHGLSDAEVEEVGPINLVSL